MKLTKSEEWIISYLKGKDYVSPSVIGTEHARTFGFSGAHHSCWASPICLRLVNTVTRTASRAEVEVSADSWLNPENMKVESDRKSRVKVEKDCYYEQALNIKNFIKRLRRRGIVGMDEEVKLER